jgi:hypothetical protein
MKGGRKSSWEGEQWVTAQEIEGVRIGIRKQ